MGVWQSPWGSPFEQTAEAGLATSPLAPSRGGTKRRPSGTGGWEGLGEGRWYSTGALRHRKALGLA